MENKKFFEVLERGIQLETIQFVCSVLNCWVTNPIPLDGTEGFNYWLRSHGYKFMLLYDEQTNNYKCIATS